MGDIAQPRQGLATADNFRFLRFWWEVGKPRIAFGCKNHVEAQATQKKWFPYMKGGAYRKWYGNQEYVVNWYKDGVEIKNLVGENGRVASRPQNTDFYFREGVTWTDLSSAGFGARYLPQGFIFDVKGSSGFPPEDLIPEVLAVLNSKWSQYALAILNPTVSFQVGDIARVPVLEKNRLSSQILSGLAHRAIIIRQQESTENETAFDFIAPPPWVNGPELAIQRRIELAELEQRVDEEIYRSYGLSGDDQQTIEEELLKGNIIV